MKKISPAMAMAARAPMTGPATQALLLPFLVELFEDPDAELDVDSGSSDDVGEGPGVDELAPGLAVSDELEVGVDNVVSVGSISKYKRAARSAHPNQCRPCVSIVLVVKTVSALHDISHAEDPPSRKYAVVPVHAVANFSEQVDSQLVVAVLHK